MARGLRARIEARCGYARTQRREREKGYDYVEVMACPGGCVNGGGQLKPPMQKTVDAEGYQRNWEESGVEVPAGGGGIEGVMQNAKWGDKEWTKKVEKAYWHDLPTPPVSPKLGTVNENGNADCFAAQILADLCYRRVPTGDTGWGANMDEEAESLRRRLFRTQYKSSRK